MKVTLSPTGINNFHNAPDLTIYLKRPLNLAGQYYPISEHQAKRIQNHFCGIKDCKCPAGGYIMETNFKNENFEYAINVNKIAVDD